MLKTLSKCLLVLLICAAIFVTGYIIQFNNGVAFIYGAHTEVVDPKAFSTPKELTAITDVSVLSPDGQSMLPKRTIVLDDGEIISVIAGGVAPDNAKIIDGRGKYVIPGLVDSHAHMLKSPNDLLLYVANGVTHVRDLGGSSERLELREEIKQGRVGPRLFISSPPLNTKSFLEGAFFELITFHKNTHNKERAVKMVKEYAEQGYGAIKTYHLDMPSYRAINKVAADIGIPTTGHLPLSFELAELATTQQREIAHLEELVRVLIREFGSIQEKGSAPFYAHVEARSDEIIDDLLANDIIVNSVLWYMESITEQFNDLEAALKRSRIEYANPGLVEGTKESKDFKVGWLPTYNQFEANKELSAEDLAGQHDFWQAREKAHHILLKAMAKRGVKIVAGTDSGGNLVVPGFSIHDELNSLNSAGMTPAQALATATTTPAKMMNSGAGTIEKGRRADLLVLNKNPLIDIGNTRSIDTVILNGRPFSREKLDDILAAVKQANDNSRKINIDEYR